MRRVGIVTEFLRNGRECRVSRMRLERRLLNTLGGSVGGGTTNVWAGALTRPVAL